jgi:hypothetical protein
MQPHIAAPPVRDIPSDLPDRRENTEGTRIGAAVSAVRRMYSGAVAECLIDALMWHQSTTARVNPSSLPPGRPTPPAPDMTRALAVVALLLALAGCGAPTAATPAGSAPTADVPVSAIVPAPVAVDIPVIGAVSSLVGLGLNPDGSLAVPPLTTPGQASWYSDGVIPGQTGPAVVAGHVSGRIDGRSIPGVFARLAELGAGDDILIERSDDTTLRFVVQRVETHDKGDFPTEAVYGDRARPELVLITCGGALDPSARSYESNVLVFAVLA